MANKLRGTEVMQNEKNAMEEDLFTFKKFVGNHDTRAIHIVECGPNVNALINEPPKMTL
jgi:hypothetical protein